MPECTACGWFRALLDQPRTSTVRDRIVAAARRHHAADPCPERDQAPAETA